MSDKNSGKCRGPVLIFACSGAADVGEIADRAAREMSRQGVAKMFCTAGIGGRVDIIMKTIEASSGILAVDGCPLNCVKNSLEQAGFTNFQHLQLAELGLEKGKSPVSEGNITKVASKAVQMIGR